MTAGEFKRAVDTWEEDWQVQPPAAVAMDPRAFVPRPVGLVGISQVYEERGLEQWTLADLGLSPEEVGLAGSPTRVANLEKIKLDRRCQVLGGNPQEQADALLELLTSAGKIG